MLFIIPAPVVFPFEGQATSHAAPPSRTAPRGVHARFSPRWRLNQLTHRGQTCSWVVLLKIIELRNPGERSGRIRIPCQTALKFRIQPLDNRFTFRPVMNIFRHRAFHTDGFSQPFAVNVAFVNPLTTLHKMRPNLPKRLSRITRSHFCTSPQVRSPIA